MGAFCKVKEYRHGRSRLSAAQLQDHTRPPLQSSPTFQCIEYPVTPNVKPDTGGREARGGGAGGRRPGRGGRRGKGVGSGGTARVGPNQESCPVPAEVAGRWAARGRRFSRKAQAENDSPTGTVLTSASQEKFNVYRMRQAEENRSWGKDGSRRARWLSQATWKHVAAKQHFFRRTAPKSSTIENKGQRTASESGSLGNRPPDRRLERAEVRPSTTSAAPIPPRIPKTRFVARCRCPFQADVG